MPECRKPGKDISTYVDKAMFAAEEVEQGALERPRVYLLSATPDPLGAVAAMSMMYEGRVIRDLTEVTDDERRHYFDEAFKTTLKAPLEAIDLHFMVEGLTRATWDQMVRQRTAVFAGESLRFAIKEQLPVRRGPSVQTRAQILAYEKAVRALHEAYLSLVGNGVSQEDARGLLPLNVLTRGHWKTNLRNLESEIGKRLCTQAQFEWRLLMADLRRAIREYSATQRRGWMAGATTGWQFKYIADSLMFRPVCFSTGKCMFKAAMDRGCLIRSRVEAGQFDQIETAEWASNPEAAYVRTEEDRP